MTFSVREWIIEFDFGTNQDEVRSNLASELTNSIGFVELQGNTLICDEIDDAFPIRMRFADNIIAVREEFLEI